MCLVITVRIPHPLGEKAASLSRARDTLTVRETREGWFGSRRTLSLSLEGGCACSTLAHDADWNVEHWKMELAAGTLLATTLERIAAEVQGDFTFEALWVGERPAERVVVTPAELTEIVREGRIGTRVRYVVHDRGPVED
jgi:hypothetical protein